MGRSIQANWRNGAEDQPIRESERLCRQGVEQLQRMGFGWPKEQIEEVVTTLMGAGMAYEREIRLEDALRNEALIQKVVAN